MNASSAFQPPDSRLRSSLLVWLSGGALAAALAWVYLPELATMARRWMHDSRYSHGFLVPLFSAYLLYTRRCETPDETAYQGSFWGVPVLLLGLALRAAGAYLSVDWLQGISLLPCLAGMAVLLGGWPALAWSWPSVAFLALMVPLPFQVETSLALPLQRVATWASTYALQTLGYPAFAEGNIIRLDDVRIGVVEACSGLSMLVIFVALSVAFAVIVRRSIWERVLLVVSAVPIAILANLTRIVVTAVLHKVAGPEWANLVFHDLAGWLMMPLGLAFLLLELRLLSWVVINHEEEPRSARDSREFVESLWAVPPTSGQSPRPVSRT